MIRADSGFTLLELMLAAGVMAIALAMLFGSVIAVGGLGKLAEDRASAAAELTSSLERVRAMSYAGLLQYSPVKPLHPGVSRNLIIEIFNGSGASFKLPYMSPPALSAPAPSLPEFPNPLEVRVTLVWEDTLGRAYSMQASTLVWR
jgi:prepilin-type N-terminal cleavage/methylation domain-containing protein